MEELQVSEEQKTVVIERTFDAPRERVWKAWTDQKLLQQWWGPEGVDIPECEVDLRVGGDLYIVMEAGEQMGPLKGTRWPMKGSFREIQEPEKLVFVSTAAEDRDSAPYFETLVTIHFKEQGEKTKMHLTITVTRATTQAEGAIAGMKAGWTQSIDKLGKFLQQ